ncbi:hypothetical protein K470DRAFT_282507 [Piedraia hortae CBS 480.64]|uniref:Integral membrane protein TmpA n=1 Tax=Piedraia hortae CBS 480.64 TaxID=1314780 RepID=A0A6A7BYK0_9PEZI|nr:hypothetical protein K470DRAFT_282507 [Piedraia hortae CBS 480.64]
MPAFTGNKWWKRQRYHVWSVYRRLMVLVIAANFGAIVAMIVRCVRYPGTFTSAEASTAVGANLVAGILMRQEHVINTFFHIAILQPRWFPAWLRRTIAKFAFHYGGVHSSAGISAIAWYIFFLVLLPLTFPGTRTESILMVALSAIVLVLLLVIAGMSHPRVRNAHHDLWELSHRFGGWSAVAVFWIQTMFSAVVAARVADLPLGRVLIKTPSFWFLIIITWCLIYPWLWLRKVPLEAVKLSNHAAELRFTHSNIGTCRGVRLSHNPLIETHAFAGIPHCPLEGDLEKGYSVIVSNAGNWTTDMIQNPPKHIWCRGVPTLGVMRLSSLLSPIIIVATGSGIGPCTSFLNVFPHHRARILWVARDPLKTYQSGLINRVRRIDPNAVIVDSTRTGKKSVPALTYALVKETKAEGVMIISNPKATSETVEAMESRGITAFGAIFDS